MKKISLDQLTEIVKAIKNEKESLSSTILKRQHSKHQRNNIITIHEKVEGLESRG